jgi:hypothetical protein
MTGIDSLSELTAEILLCSADNDARDLCGWIYRIDYAGGFVFKCGRASFPREEYPSARTLELCLDSLNQLLQLGYIKSDNEKKFSITTLGWDMVETLKNSIFKFTGFLTKEHEILILDRTQGIPNFINNYSTNLNVRGHEHHDKQDTIPFYGKDPEELSLRIRAFRDQYSDSSDRIS